MSCVFLDQKTEKKLQLQMKKIRENQRKKTKVRGRLLCWYQFVVLQLFGVNALWVVDGSINLTDAHTLGPKPVQVPHGVETHITKALWNVTASSSSPLSNITMTITLKSLNTISSKHFQWLYPVLLNNKVWFSSIEKGTVVPPCGQFRL